MADNIKFGAPLLGISLDRVRSDLPVTTQTVLDFLYKSPLFDPDRRSLLEQGVNAYLEGDHVKTIHVLTPQIEHKLRRLLAMLGGATSKHRRSDSRIMIEKSLNDILESEPMIQQCLGADITMYLRVFLCEPLGFNLRNNLAHGLLRPETFHRVYSDRLIHILLILAMFQPKDAAPDRDSDHKSTCGVPLAEDHIAKAAYYIWEKSGKTHGHDLEDWFKAKRELEGTTSPPGN